MRLEFNWGLNFELPWLEKLHDYVWEGDDEEGEDS